MICDKAEKCTFTICVHGIEHKKNAGCKEMCGIHKESKCIASNTKKEEAE